MKKTGDRSNIQSGGDGRNQDLNGTVEIIQPTKTVEAEISTTSIHNKNNNNNNKVKWVHNLSKTPLTEVQEKVLAHGPNFAITTKEPPVSEYVSQNRKSMPAARKREGRRAQRQNQTDPQENTAAQAQHHPRGSQSHTRVKKR